MLLVSCSTPQIYLSFEVSLVMRDLLSFSFCLAGTWKLQLLMLGEEKQTLAISGFQ